MTRATHFVARRGIEPQTIYMKGERFNHCATDLAVNALEKNIFNCPVFIAIIPISSFFAK